MKNILSFNTAAQWLCIIIFILEISLECVGVSPRLTASKLQRWDLNSGIVDRLFLGPALSTMPSGAPAVSGAMTERDRNMFINTVARHEYENKILQ